MKPRAFQSQKDVVKAASKRDAGGGGMPRLSQVCFVAVLTTAFWALVLNLRGGTQDNGGGEASVQHNRSAFSVPLLSGIIVDGRRRLPIEQSPPAIDAMARVSSPLLEDGSMADRCAGRYIYVHDLPPRFNEDLVRGCSKLRSWVNMCPVVANCGMGQYIGETDVFLGRGWYATDQFIGDVIFNCRMKRYECLTDDPALAAAVLVPFYASLDAGMHQRDGSSAATRDALALDLVAWLVRRREWRAMGGRDHFLVTGRPTWDFHGRTDADEEWGTKLLNIPAVRNMTALVVETGPTTSPQWRRAELVVPYPTYFHPETAADVAAWQETVRRTERKWLFSFVGGPRPGSYRTVRAEIVAQCRASSRCRHLRCTSQTSSRPTSCESSPGAGMRVLERSTFCLQPRGDTATRRSTFDAIVAGCIPVFFHPDSAYTQYTLHFPRDPSSYSVLIMHTDITGPRNVSIEETLSRIPAETVAAMRQEVIRLIPKVVYADPRSRHVDFKDAFDVALEAVIDRVAKRRREAAMLPEPGDADDALLLSS